MNLCLWSVVLGSGMWALERAPCRNRDPESSLYHNRSMILDKSSQVLVSPQEVSETEKWVVRTQSVRRTDGAAEDESCYGIGIVITRGKRTSGEEGLKRSPISLLFTPAGDQEISRSEDLYEWRMTWRQAAKLAGLLPVS